MEKAYICSPLAGNEKQNINNAIAYAKFVYNRCNMIPLMSHFYALILDDSDAIQRKTDISISIGQILNSHHLWVFGNTILTVWAKKSEMLWHWIFLYTT